MISFELQGDKFSTPKDWSVVKFSKFLKYLEEILPTMPKSLQSLYQSENMVQDWLAMPKRNKSKCYQYFAKSVGFWCELPQSTIEQSMDLEQLESAYWTIDVDLSMEEMTINEDFTGFAIGKTEYLLPAKHMIGSTVLEFTEAAQFELNMAEVKNGKWLAMLDVMAVLCRPKDEAYSYEKEKHDSRKRLFSNVTMDIILNVSFFFFRLNKTLSDNLLIYSLQMLKAQNEAKQSQKLTGGI